ncbi:lysophospholipid acyltransferase family protein [Actinomadura livida]|uniref:1-acyl-sn-glycerol-3-phosphate acyltransferase n=1 Tax=Actinomadura livida TaxID=79909 RepID=A0A7W7IHM4_9ACTN|nr:MULTISPECIES: lysophospholipid acyltransferase family protein [Actinomadura]MBB4776928.1 1-acyl-sn-glycerol-3-phosphate acyltransferase [Actinomadura catellatispora]GGT95808.1 1-acyl-sn-glycerol-3-phosphate acyltransferase [Actinomadura livida]
MSHGYSPAWRKLTIVILRPLLRALLKRDWRGRGNVPGEGGVIIAANHISEADPLALAHFVYGSGRYPVYLAKSTLFETRFVRTVLRGTGQIPVYRDRADASLALRDAEQALRDGECLVFYPEGSCTRDPELWPMTGQTGVARMALTTGAKVVPVANWGAHELLPYKKGARTGLAGRLKKGFHPFPRKTMKVAAGPPVDLSRYADRPLTRETLRAATDDIMAAITGLLGELRGEEPPKERYDHHRVLEERRAAARAAGEAFEPAVPEPAVPEAAVSEPARQRTGDPKAADS